MAEEKPPSEPIKKDLEKLLNKITHQEDWEIVFADEAIDRLDALKLSRIASTAAGGSSRSRSPVVPEFFRCPISGELMKDPVILKTGQVRREKVYLGFGIEIFCLLFCLLAIGSSNLFGV